MGTHLVGSLTDSTSWRLLQLLRVLEEEGVAQARAQEQVPGLHGDHLREGVGEGSARPEPMATQYLYSRWW